MPSQPNAYKGWNKDEVDQLRKMFRRGVHDEVIASRLGRTARSVAVKRYKLGLVSRAIASKGKSLRTYSDAALIDEVRRRGHTVIKKPGADEL